MKIFLLGLPGSGKSTLGEQVANYLQIEFIDLDSEIEQEESQSIAEIFKSEGEEYFRSIEEELLYGFLKNDHAFVMATGGGTPCYGANLKKMKESGITIFLDVEIEELISRLSQSSQERALLKGENLKEQVEKLYYERLEIYFQAHIILTGSNLVSETVISALDNFKT